MFLIVEFGGVLVVFVWCLIGWLVVLGEGGLVVLFFFSVVFFVFVFVFFSFWQWPVNNFCP